MPPLSEHHSSNVTKLLFLGDAKSGKTTALGSLVKAGYKLRILDLDNLLDSLKEWLLANCPDLLDNVEFRTLRDSYKSTALGMRLEGKATAFVSAMKMLEHWKYDTTDLGDPAQWGPDSILVVDSLSRLCDAAYDFHYSIARPGKSGEIDGRAVYGDAQDAVEMTLANLTSASFQTNIIVICHGQYMELPDQSHKIFPQGVGQKLSPKIPQYFPVYIRLKNIAGKRTIQLESDPMIDLAMPKAEIMGKTLPADTGLATIFATLRGQPTTATPAESKPKAVTLQKRV